MKVMVSLLVITGRPVEVYGPEMISKLVCIGGSILLFEKALLHIIADDVSLYHPIDGLIATWDTNRTLHKNDLSNVFRDESGNVWLSNIKLTDEGIYLLQHSKGPIATKIYNLKLDVLVAPTKNCKPRIERVRNVLITSLPDADCGKPQASVYFVELPGISYESNATIARLSPGTEAGTYTACIESAALGCVTGFKPSDFCGYLTINQSSYQEISSYMITAILVIVAIILLVLLGIIALLVWYIRPIIVHINKRLEAESTPMVRR